MKKQYLEIKAQHPDCLLFFRLGDFYEMFDEDAKVAAEELNLTLTTRDRNKPLEEAPPCAGCPTTLPRPTSPGSLPKGYKGGHLRADRGPAQAKGLVDREVIGWSPPAPSSRRTCWRRGKNNFLAALCATPPGRGCALGTSPPGRWSSPSSPAEGMGHRAVNELARFAPGRSSLSPGRRTPWWTMGKNKLGGPDRAGRGAAFALDRAWERVRRQVHPGGWTRCPREAEAAIQAAGALLSYLYETQKNRPVLPPHPALLRRRPVFGAGPRGPAEPGAHRDPPGQGRRRAPSSGCWIRRKPPWGGAAFSAAGWSAPSWTLWPSPAGWRRWAGLVDNPIQREELVQLLPGDPPIWSG